MAKILWHRRCGNTTRQVDEWIQQLFEEGKCIVIDHADRPENAANRHAERIILQRLKMEHGLEPGRSSMLKWDDKSKTLTLLDHPNHQ